MSTTSEPEGERQPQAVTALVADDHPVLRSSMRAELEESGFCVCAEAGDAESAVEAALRFRPALCVLDVHMPGGGIEAARAIVAALPETRVAMLTVSRADDDFVASVRAGATGYLLKDIDPKRLASSLRDVAAGKMVFPPALAARTAHLLPDADSTPPPS
jgi:two-component system, NarL family, nitrate/nitrite response regulator NarL